jgi:hypothetical protein
MINQLEIPIYLEEAIPEFFDDLMDSSKRSTHELMHKLIDFTFNNIKDKNYTVVERCFRIADRLYRRGNAVVKNAIENIFVYSFTKMFTNYSTEKDQLVAIIPVNLYSVYISQVCHRGC